MSDEKTNRLDKAPEAKPTRRDLLGKIGTGAFAGAGALCAIGLGRALVPRALPDPAEQFKIGPPQDYPEGTVREFTDENVIVFRDKDGMYAISTVCTHLGCVVTFDDETGFECPCHGSTFAADGKVTKGPAPTPLPWWSVAQLPSGQLAGD
jgi:cytochrome b6-f complex iron-sulfur subunit